MENFSYHNSELSEKNILEEFYELIEKHRLSSNSDFQLGDFYDILSDFDLSYQTFNTSNGEVSTSIVNRYLTHSLTVFLVFFKLQGFSDRPLFYAFKRFIYWFSLALKKSQGIKSSFFFERNFRQNFPTLWQNSFINYLVQQQTNNFLDISEQFGEIMDKVQMAENLIAEEFGVIADYDGRLKTELLIFGSEFTVTELEISEEYSLIEVGIHYEMTLDISITDESNDGSKLIHSLNLILASIANVDNVKVEIESIATGSLFTRVRIYMKDLVAKEEVKAVLETTKEAIGKTLTAGQVSHSEVQKNVAETNKSKIEQRLLKKELKSKPTTYEAKISNALDLEKKALENEQLKIQNIKAKLEVIEKLSDLAVKGILEADAVKIDINEITYLLKSEKQELQLPDTNIDEIT